MAPHVVRVGVLRELQTPAGSGQLGAMQAAASSFRVELKALDVRDTASIERGLSVFATAILWRTAVWFLMGSTITTCGKRLRDMLIVFSRERNRLSSRFKSPPNLSWSSTSRPLRRSDLLCRPHCSPRADEVIE